MVNTFINVARVELLKGAQGGLYGRNATGGVLNVITQQPSTDGISGSGLVSYGEKNTFRAASFFNLPLNENIAVSLSAERSSHDGYVRNLATRNPYSAANFPTGAFLPTGPGRSFVFNTPQQTAAAFNSYIDPRPMNDLDLWAVNAKLLMKLGDDLRITFAGDYVKKNDNQGNAAYQLAPAVPQATLTGLFNAFGINFMETPGFFRASNGKYTAVQSLPTSSYVKDYGVSTTAVLSLPIADITSITAYRRHIPKQVNELSNLNVPLFRTNPPRSAWFFYQELRGVSTGNGPFHLLGGATYLRNHFEQSLLVDVIPPLILGDLTRSVLKLDNWSVYAQASYDLTSALSLTVSGRYIHEKNNTRFTAPVAVETRTTEKKFLPSATLSYQLEDGGNIYARWARGFKGGGINPAFPPTFFPTSRGSAFKGEQVDTYEVGYRASLFDRHVQLTAAAFYNGYKNLQVVTTGNLAHPEIIFAIVNAGSARTYGAEGSLTWKMSDPITVGLATGYLNAKYKKFSNLNDPVLLSFDRSGGQMILSPKFQLSLTGSLDQPINRQFRLVGNVLAAHLSKTIFVDSPLPGIAPNAEQPAYWLVNMRAGVRTSDDRYGLAIVVNNLFNKFYTTFGNAAAATGTTEFIGNPRIISAELTFKF
jgi:iron complex outermembrane receptor protein